MYEETGQKVLDLEFIGLLKSKKTSNGKIKHNPVYYVEVEEVQPFIENEETSEIKLCDLKEKIGYLDSVDIRIFEFI